MDESNARFYVDAESTASLFLDTQDLNQRQLVDDVKTLLQSGHYSDLNITCGPDTYRAHRAIVCTRAKFFAGAARFPGAESEKKSVDLPDEDPMTFKLLMHFLYEGDYAPILESSVLEDGYHQAMGIRTTPQQAAFPHTCVTSSSHPSPRTIRVRCTETLCYHHTCSVQCNTPSAGLANPAPVACVNFTCPECPLAKDKPSPAVIKPEDLLTHAKMYAIADRLIVGGLKHLVKTKFLVTCHYHWNSPQFSEAVEYVFTSTPEKDKGMRFIVCRTIANHITLLKDPKIKEMMMEFNDLAYGVLGEKAKQQKWL